MTAVHRCWWVVGDDNCKRRGDWQVVDIGADFCRQHALKAAQQEGMNHIWHRITGERVELPLPAVTAPWPTVGECYWPASSLVRAGHQCQQCDGSHDHQWVTWHDAPQTGVGSVVCGHGGPGLPTRCTTCGGRKCDMTACWERRHHAGPHVNVDGDVIRTVGA